MAVQPLSPATDRCGISNCFRLLFHTQRQIAYALLTRPPLTVFLQFVRLECVRHAASVHPEPGSNSLVIIINRLPSGSCFLPERFSCSITFSSFQSFFSGFLALSPSYFYQVFRCLKFCCSIFKDRQRSCARTLRKRTPFWGEPYYSTISRLVCQEVFLIFFGFFQKKVGARIPALFRPEPVFFDRKRLLFSEKRKN